MEFRKHSEVKEGDSITLYIPNLVDKFPDMVAEGYSYDDVTAFAKKYGILSLFAYTTSSAAFCGMKFPCSGHTVTRAY